MRIVLSVLRHILRALIAIVAVGNLAALFLFSYKIPDRLQSRIGPYLPPALQSVLLSSSTPGSSGTSASAGNGANGNETAADGQTVSDQAAAGTGEDGTQGAGGQEAGTQAEGATSAGTQGEGAAAAGASEGAAGDAAAASAGVRLVVPSMTINYSGGDLDLLDGVYLQYPDGTRVEDADITTKIEPGSTRLDKNVSYSTVLADGTELTGKRAIRIGSRYTGPSITVIGEVPEVSPGDNYRLVVRQQIMSGNVYAEDGFGNDITRQVQGRLDKETVEESEDASGEDAEGEPGEEPVDGQGEDTGEGAEGSEEAEEIRYRLVFYVTNAVGDTAEMTVQDEMVGSGVVCKLVTDDLTLDIGTPFYFQDYVAECHDSHGNALSPQVSGIVNSYAYGDYSIDIWCTDENGVSSPVRTLNVHIV